MNRSVICFLFLLFTILAGSCTVEKRLYNKGWHISANHSWKTDRSGSLNPASAVAEMPFSKEAPAAEAFHPEVRSAEEAPVILTDTTVNRNTESQSVVVSGEKAVPDTVVVEKARRDEQAATRKSPDPDNYWSRGAKTTVAIILAVLAIAAIVALIFLLASAFSTALTVAEFILLGLLFFGLAILMTILFFVALTIPTSEEMHERAEDKRKVDLQRKKELDQLSPEEREERLREEAETAARNKRTRTTVLAVLGAFFAAALVISFLL